MSLHNASKVSFLSGLLLSFVACGGGDSGAPSPEASAGQSDGGGGQADLGGQGGMGGEGDVLQTNASGQGGSIDACVSETVKASLYPLDMLVMLDRSLSMDDDGKWDAVTQALGTFAQTPAQADGISMGIDYFPRNTKCTVDGDCGGGFGSCSGWGWCEPYTPSCEAYDYKTPEVPIAALPANAGALVSSLQKMNPIGGTPTAPALQGAHDAAASWSGDHPDHKTVVVLATDGIANTCWPIDAAGLAAIASLGFSSHGIPTFVIGVGFQQEQLDAIASAGGTGQPIFVDVVQNPAEAFLDALDAVRASAIGCTYKIPQPSLGVLDPTKVNVEVTPPSGSSDTLGQVAGAAACGVDGGWYYDSPTAPSAIVLCPGSCTALKDKGGVVDIVLGCQTIVN